jgi:drug/metabolite transporter (DMT)-like permease
VLGIVGTGLAQLLVNQLIGEHGPARTMLVNYLLPGFALLYGATILGEPLTGAKVAGLHSSSRRHSRARPGRQGALGQPRGPES